jgi:hypothetical protein
VAVRYFSAEFGEVRISLPNSNRIPKVTVAKDDKELCILPMLLGLIQLKKGVFCKDELKA